MRRLNDALDRAALTVTTAVGTAWCALIFAALACVSLPTVLNTGDLVQIVGWVAQTFLQLVLLSVIMVGQRLQSAATEDLIRDTHELVKHEVRDVKLILKALHQKVDNID